MGMKKYSLCATLLAILVSCSSNDLSSNSNNANGITIKAGLSEEAATRVSFESQGEDTKGLKVGWEHSDVLEAVLSGTSSTGSFMVSSIEADTHNAAFNGNFSSTPTDGATVNGCVKTSNATISGSAVTFNLATQSGNVGDLGKYDIVTGSGQYKSNSPINMTMKHQLSFLKAYITLPAPVTATTATVTLKGTGLVNSVTWNGSTDTFSDAQPGNLTLTGTVNGDQVIVYAAVYPGTLTNLTADVTIDATTYSNLGVTESTTLEAGKLYTVSRNVSTIDDTNLWINDEAWSKVIPMKNYKIIDLVKEPTEGSDWLNATSDGSNVILSATANTTGAPRQATLTFTNGVSTTTVDITQLEEKDFQGIWDMTSYYVYSSNGSSDLSTIDTSWNTTATKPSDGLTDMLIKDGINYNNSQELNIQNTTGTTANAADGLSQTYATHTNNLCISGLYENLKTEAWANVDFTKKTATVGVFIDTRSTTKAQRLYTGPYAGQYAALMPELRTKGVTTDGSGWVWNFATIGGSDATKMWWYMGKVTVKGHTTAITWYADKSNARQNLTTSTGYDVWGLEVERYINTSINTNTMIRKASGTTSAGAYAITYQGDMIMKRTAEGYKDITIGGNN